MRTIHARRVCAFSSDFPEGGASRLDARKKEGAGLFVVGAHRAPAWKSGSTSVLVLVLVLDLDSLLELMRQTRTTTLRRMNA